MDQKTIGFVVLLALSFVLQSCEKEVRNIAPTKAVEPEEPNMYSSRVNPIDIEQQGFGFLEKMQGVWIGENKVIAEEYDWFSFDYRPISSSHTYGIFEGGSAGNLMTSFFVADFKDTRTIMARNGGLLNGIYRSSYFVMDSVNVANNGEYFRFVDAVGGSATMFMELRFTNDSLYFNAYTSRLGANLVPTRHMTFKASRQYAYLAQQAAAEVGYPTNTPAWDFSDGFVEDALYVNTGQNQPKSASFLAEDPAKDVFTLAQEALDPFTILDHPRLAYLQVDIVRNAQIDGLPWFLYLSTLPLTDNDGYLVGTQEPFNSVVRFSDIIGSQDSFLQTYLHPGDYYINVIVDANGDGFISSGDITAKSRAITVQPEDQLQVTIDNITIQN